VSGLDRIRVPENRRWQFSMVVAVFVALGLMVSASWWSGEALWRFAAAAGGSAFIGWIVARAFVRWTGP
jgi:hypothetical protein